MLQVIEPLRAVKFFDDSTIDFGHKAILAFDQRQSDGLTKLPSKVSTELDVFH